ncbi:MAG: hypothetical protein J0L97_10535 [Alphaproteobacteria bacterium]|nr:hypothetical protein [Alphaproteobacteria bacterium]
MPLELRRDQVTTHSAHSLLKRAAPGTLFCQKILETLGPTFGERHLHEAILAIAYGIQYVETQYGNLYADVIFSRTNDYLSHLSVYDDGVCEIRFSTKLLRQFANARLDSKKMKRIGLYGLTETYDPRDFIVMLSVLECYRYMQWMKLMEDKGYREQELVIPEPPISARQWKRLYRTNRTWRDAAAFCAKAAAHMNMPVRRPIRYHLKKKIRKLFAPRRKAA